MRNSEETFPAGAHAGRPPLEPPDNFGRIVEMYEKGAVTAEAAAYMAGMSRATFFRKIGSLGHATPHTMAAEEKGDVNSG